MSRLARVFSAMVAAATVLAASGCGSGGGDGQIAGIDRGGAPAVTSGPISGFGSVIVNDIRFDTSNTSITIDGQPARIQTQTACPGEIDATVVVGRRVYEFTFQSDRSDIREIYDAYVSTIDLRPEDAALPSASPSS